MAILLCAWPTAAQEQRGSIEGVIKDSSGAVLPGVTVEARTNTGVVLTATTDSEGVYRFPSLLPGIYEITATLTGFAPRKQADVVVNLGQVKKVDLALGLQGVAESVQVTAESPLVDVKQSARQTNIRAEQVELLPHGRDFTTLVTQAPGANNESKLGGLSIDGASAAENRYIIDGIETTNLQNGTSGKNVISEFVEEVQVKSSGYTAEFGGATGGVINVLTKSGTNDWHGNVLFNWESSKLAGESTPTLRSVPGSTAAVTPVEYVTYPKDKSDRVEPGFSLGGPIFKNRAWFFGAYQPAYTNVERIVNPTTAHNTAANTFDVTQKNQVQYATGNVTSQLSDSLRSRLAFNNSWSKSAGQLPSLSGTDNATTDYSKGTKRPNYSVSGNVDWVASQKLFFGFRGGYYDSDAHDFNVPTSPRIIFSTGNNLNFPEVPPSLQRGSGFQNIPSNSLTDHDQQTRAYFQGDGTWYAKGAGDHQVKFGVQADRLGNNVLTGESNNLVRLRWNTQLISDDPTSRGTYGYYQVRSNGIEPKKGLITQGNIHMNVIGLFLQDAWTVNNKLTVNVGVRTEQEKVPTYETGADIPQFGVEFNFKDKIAPRAGFAYDINGDGKWKAFGSWGVFYDIFKLEMPRGSFGGDKWLEYYYTLDTYDWTNLTASPSCPPACPGRLLRGPVDFRHPSFGTDALEPNLKPMRQQEATFGLEHQLSEVVAGSVRYVHKQLDRGIEDVGTLDADGNEIYIIANPGEGITTKVQGITFDPGTVDVNLPKPKRDYDSVEFAIEKRFANNWFLRSSYLWSRLNGNYAGLSQSDENGRVSPNVGRGFDYPIMMFKDGGQPSYGPLATDRPHQFKTQFIYQLKMGTSVGLNQYVASGLPVSREVAILPPNSYPVQYLGRGSDGRTPVYSQTDLLVAHNFHMGAQRAFQINFNVINLFNQDTAVSKNSTYQYSGGVKLDEVAFYAGQQTIAQQIVAQGVVQNPAFLMNNGFQNPIQARLGFKFLF
jgi:carboxypeptidase family protein/TonB-dependent receptor-like protein